MPSMERGMNIAAIQSYLSNPGLTPAQREGGNLALSYQQGRSQEELRKENINTLRGVGRTIEGALSVPRRGISEFTKDWPTPGGTATPLIVLLLFMTILIAVNGKSRFQWFWDTFIGQAHITGGGSTISTSGFGGNPTGQNPYLPGASGKSPSGKNCILPTGGSQTDVENYCACLNNLPAQGINNAANPGYQSCLRDNAGTTSSTSFGMAYSSGYSSYADIMGFTSEY